MIASIVANKGFIRQFANGGTKLDPKHVSTFGGVYSAGMVLGQFVIQWPLEWLGRRGGVWVCCVVLALVSGLAVVTAGDEDRNSNSPAHRPL